jgi:hypothetical protein
MKKTTSPAPVTPQTPVFPRELHEVRPSPEKIMPGAKAPKRENIFSKSRDNREDRGEREIKTSQNPQTNHGRK